MKLLRLRPLVMAGAVVLGLMGPGPGSVAADVSFAEVVRRVNTKVVKIFGGGGFRGIQAYCTGVLISADGFILTVYTPTITVGEIIVHLYDGTRHRAELVAAEPTLDVALLRITERDRFKDQPLEFVDLAAPMPAVEVGTWILAFTNAFEVATRDEPVSVQRGLVAAIGPFAGRKGVFQAAYQGQAYFLDAITNNPGASGGLVTTRGGEPIGLVGKELRNTLTATWVNYAIPLPVVKSFALAAMRGEYRRVATPEPSARPNFGAYHGIVLVPDVLDRTPPFVESVHPGSPAALAGLRPDDLILFIRVPLPGPGEWDERVVHSCKMVHETLAGVPPDTTIKVVARRGGQLVSLDLTLAAPRKP